MAEPIIRLEHLTKCFGSGEDQVHALEDISIDIQPGEIFGVIGLSGAGKSTLVRCVNLLERPTSGQVIVDGRDMMSLPDRELREARKSIGMIFQSFNLLMQRTAQDNICFPMELAGVPRRDAVQRARELLEIVDLAGRAGAYPTQLSGGQKQRVAIARTLATNPKVLLCDEATSALDPKTTRDILRLIQDINRRLGITVVVITHEMKVIEEICSRVAILDHGRLAETGTVEEQNSITLVSANSGVRLIKASSKFLWFVTLLDSTLPLFPKSSSSEDKRIYFAVITLMRTPPLPLPPAAGAGRCIRPGSAE